MPRPSTTIKQLLNSGLAQINLKVETLHRDTTEVERLRRLEISGRFDDPVYTLPPFTAITDELAALYETCRNDLDRFLAGSASAYKPTNPWFPPSDAGIQYLLLRARAPQRIVEVGCGNSTLVSRQAIVDGNLSTRLEAIDPAPRRQVAHLVDRMHESRLEEFRGRDELFGQLETGDVLFVDSSHETLVSGDVVQLFLEILPALPPGVLVHVHDIYLPYEYPRDIVFEEKLRWSEQYLLHAFLQGSKHQILWPGYYLQRDSTEVLRRLPFFAEPRAQSFWFATG